MSLDIHWGILSIVKIVIYFPIPFFVIRICLNRGTKAGWVFLFIFSLVRIVGSAVMIAAEQISPALDSLYIAGYAMDAAGFSFLLLCTLGLLEVIAEGPHGQKRILRILGIYALGAAAVGNIVGAIASLNSIPLFVGTIFLVGLCAILILIVVVVWTKLHVLLEYRRKLLIAVTVALPFLAVRTAYSMLSIIPFKLTSFGVTNPYAPSNLEQFDMFTGAWQLYLVMAVCMEYATVIIFTVAGNTLPLESDYHRRVINGF